MGGACGRSRPRRPAAPAPSTTAPGDIALLEPATGAWTTAALYTAAKRDADQLAAGPKHSNDVAARVGADPDACTG